MPSHSAETEQSSRSQERDTTPDFRRLLARLASRARWLGAKDPEGVAQEALKRSLENPISKSAVEYYFSQDLLVRMDPPEWPLDQLLAWLHGVIHYIVREERHRASSQREVPFQEITDPESNESRHTDPVDPMPDHLERLIQQELREIVVGCFTTLENEYQRVLTLRTEGLKYGEIATQLGINENTVATWVSRGIRDLAQCVSKRTRRVARRPKAAGQGNTHE
ncbi:MAG: RNA polymerase sigma factor [Terriglobia bacterium]